MHIHLEAVMVHVELYVKRFNLAKFKACKVSDLQSPAFW